MCSAACISTKEHSPLLFILMCVVCIEWARRLSSSEEINRLEAGGPSDSPRSLRGSRTLWSALPPRGTSRFKASCCGTNSDRLFSSSPERMPQCSYNKATLKSLNVPTRYNWQTQTTETKCSNYIFFNYRERAASFLLVEVTGT